MSVIKKTFEWLKQHLTRKFTVIWHILGGVFCALLWYFHPGLSLLIFISFGLFEWWQCEAEGDMGYNDFWDAVFGLFIGAIILVILYAVGCVDHGHTKSLC